MPLSTAAFPCCRDHDLFAPVEEYPQRIHRTPGDEAYWFCWDSSFDGKATIRIAKLRDDVMVSRIYRASRFGKVRRFRGFLAPNDWSRLEDAIVAANFWMLDERGGRDGLDGSTWRFAARRIGKKGEAMKAISGRAISSTSSDAREGGGGVR